ncbi:MAG: response regulator [Nitrososphaeraceae archaeon]
MDKNNDIIKLNNNHSFSNKADNNIAIVDDDKDILELYSEYLTFNGFKVLTFDNPLELLNHLQNNTYCFSLVIADYRMPRMSGIELIQNIRKMNNHCDHKMKFILISAFLEDDVIFENKEIMSEIKIDKILEKPVRLEELKSTVIELLN